MLFLAISGSFSCEKAPFFAQSGCKGTALLRITQDNRRKRFSFQAKLVNKIGTFHAFRHTILRLDKVGSTRPLTQLHT